jgi:hypothetical protein
VAYCLEPHDLVLAKCVAGRERDWEFAQDALTAGVVEPGELLARVPDLPVDEQQRNYIATTLAGIINGIFPCS